MGNLDFNVIATLLAPFLSFILGLISLGIVWIFRTVFTNRRDLNAAFSKIRNLEDEVYGRD